MTARHPLTAQDAVNRRVFLRHSTALGLTALATLAARGAAEKPAYLLPAARAKRIIYLFQSGAPSQLDLFDPKPQLDKRRGEDLPDTIRKGQRLTTMTSGQARFPVAPSIFKFARRGQSGLWMSDLLPHLAVHTEAINHDPAITFCQTGNQLAGRPSIGAWVSYGLGSENGDLPAYVVLTSFGSGRRDDQPLYDRLWGAGFLPSRHQGVKFRNKGDAVLYLSNPPGVDADARRSTLDRLAALNKQHFESVGDPETQARIAQYEMAFRMQTSVPELLNTSKEDRKILDTYGPEVSRPGSYAANCLLARRLSERGVRFVQLFHMGWDHHGGLPAAIRGQCKDTDQPTAALIRDLKQRGLLDDTLIVWGGEFGRTVYSQGALTETNYGRDHHPRCYTVLLAGGGVKAGVTFGATDDYSYNVTENPVSVFDLNATILNQLGINHERLTYKFQGLDARLTGVEPARVVREVLA
jgi:uncharacterized protein (DUF1501 family)